MDFSGWTEVYERGYQDTILEGGDEDGKVVQLLPRALGTAAGQKGCEGYLQGAPFPILTISDSKRIGLYTFFFFFFLNLVNKRDTINELTGIVIFLIWDSLRSSNFGWPLWSRKVS